MTEARPIQVSDPPALSLAFRGTPWDRGVEHFEQLLALQEAEARVTFVGLAAGQIAGFASLVWKSDYPPFRTAGIPEIQDLNVLPDQRRRGIATRLLDEAEARIAERSPIAGISFGLTADYGAAQRLYVLRGYVPDGRGITASHTPVEPGSEVKADDDLVFWMTKRLV